MPLRIGIIDSGVHATHPHVEGVSGGVGIAGDDYVDRLGHGTAVAAVIREKAPAAELYAVKIFDRELKTNVEDLVQAIGWCVAHQMRLINLSLGTANPAHAQILQQAIDQAQASNTWVISAGEWLPGSLPGATPVFLDWECPRDAYRTQTLPDGRVGYFASGYPRPRPGVPPERNLRGISFAVANVTGLLAREIQNAARESS